jgi:hypothetical protein
VEFNDREIAMFIWTGIILAWLIPKPGIPQAIGGVLRALVQPVILGFLLSFAAYVAALVWLADRCSLWGPELINETIYWFLLSGLVLFGGVTRVFKEDDFFSRAARRTLTLSIVAEVIVNLVVMPLWIELFLVPLISLVVVMQVIAEAQEEHAQLKSFLGWVSAVIGFALLAYVGISLAGDPSQFDALYYAQLVALPVWLTLISLPFIYLVGLYAAYDQAFRRMSFVADNSGAARRAKMIMLRRFHLRARCIGAFNGGWQRRLLEAASAGRAGAVISEFLQEQKQATA